MIIIFIYAELNETMILIGFIKHIPKKFCRMETDVTKMCFLIIQLSLLLWLLKQNFSASDQIAFPFLLVDAETENDFFLEKANVQGPDLVITIYL